MTVTVAIHPRRRCLVVGVMLLCGATTCLANFTEDIVAAAHERTLQQISYDGKYFAIDYPGGDVPATIGVCTDVVIRAYRALGTDLQQLVHEDMRENFSAYPSKRIWNQNAPDKNIDHRRVPNLQVFFSRHGDTLVVSAKAQDYHPGELVTWMLPGNLPHIGIVSDRINPATGNPMIVHNIGRGPELDDILFSYPITGHYRYIPREYRNPQ